MFEHNALNIERKDLTAKSRMNTQPPLREQQVGHVAMRRILDTAPYLARCSDNKIALHIRPREHAIRRSYMEVNRPDMVSWLVFDLDHGNPNIWDDQDLPPPNFIVRDKHKNTAHLYYAIVSVCKSDKARVKPIRFMKRVYKTMAKLINADPSYAGVIAKTPHHPMWCTTEFHGYVYELSELAAHIDIEYTPNWTEKENKDTSHSRNCTLFESLRRFAYSVVDHYREHSHFEAFKSRLEEYAQQCNDFTKRGFSANLKFSEIKATAKSVARWTWENYVERDFVNRGVMNLDDSLTLEERQSLAAKRTHRERRSNSAQKVLDATKKLVAGGLKVTYSAIARVSKLCRQTVKKYQSIIDSIMYQPDIISTAELLDRQKTVNYAVSGNCAIDLIAIKNSEIVPKFWEVAVNRGLPRVRHRKLKK